MQTKIPSSPIFLLATLLILAAPASLAQEEITRVIVQTVESRALQQEVPVTGSVSSPRVSAISSEISGLVSRVQVDAGDQVSQGELLLELEPELSEIARARTEAELAQAREIMADSERRFHEAEKLAANNNIAASELRSRQAQMATDAAAAQVAETHLREQQALLRRHQVKAPFSGTVSQRMVNPGEWITPGTAVLELIDTEDLRIDFQVPQRFYAKIDDQTRLSLTIDVYADQEFEAQVHRKVPLSASNARTFLVRALIQNQAPELIPGMSVSGQLMLDLERTALVVPRDAVRRYPDGRTSVWILSERDGDQGQVTERQVNTGMVFGEHIEIRSGLEQGQELVTRGNEALQDGQRVRVE